MVDPKTNSEPIAWCCSLCRLTSVQRSAASYVKHLEDLHLEEQQHLSPAEFQEWKSLLIKQAFTPPSLIPTSPNASVPVDLKKLTLSPAAQLGKDETHPPRRPISLDDSRIPSSPVQQGNPPHRPSSANNFQPQKDFSAHTMQIRPNSRQNDPVEDDERRKRKAPVTSTMSSPTTSQPVRRGVIEAPVDPRYPNMIMQPDSRGISQEQLGKEVRAIYAGLTMVEAKAISLDKAKMEAAQSGNLPYKALYGLLGVHKALLNEHHDFFLASQHPSASPGLHKLASKYAMPARMWKHGIHSFLELLRHQLPHSLEFMIQFIILAYQMMALLLETVPSFEDTWIECLGDLSRYRMAVEDEDPKDREIWANVARYWYCKAADKMPNVGRLYHHLAILARGNPLQQLYLYSRSLTSAQPFASARESIQSLLEPAMRDEMHGFPDADIAFVKVHSALFYRKFNSFEKGLQNFHNLLDHQINKLAAKWREYGVYIASSNIGALFDFGQRNYMTQLFEVANFLSLNMSSSPSADEQARFSELSKPIELDEQAKLAFDAACHLFFETFKIVLQRPYDKNTQPFLHVTLAFLQTLLSFRRFMDDLPNSSKYVVHRFLERTPWQLIANSCNTSLKLEEFGSHFETLGFLSPEKSGESGCLPEDYLLWGKVWTQTYYPLNHFANANQDEERSIELPSTMHIRAERNLHLAFKIARENDDHLYYSSKLRKWKVEEDVIMEDAPDQIPPKSLIASNEASIGGSAGLRPEAQKTAIIGPGFADSVAAFSAVVTQPDIKIAVLQKVVDKLVLDSKGSSISSNQSRSALGILHKHIMRKDVQMIDEDWVDVSEQIESVSSDPAIKSSCSDIGDSLIKTALKKKAASKDNLLRSNDTTADQEEVILFTNDTDIRQKAENASIRSIPYNSIRSGAQLGTIIHVTAGNP